MNKKILLISGVVVLILILLGVCAFLYLSNENSPKAVVNQYYKYQKQLDTDNSQKLVDNPTEYNKDEQAKINTKKYMEKFSWNIESQKIDGNKATVKVRINKVDMQELSKKLIGVAFANAFDTTKTEEEKNKELTNTWNNEIDRKDVKMIDQIYTINLVKKDSKWKIANDSNLSQSLSNTESDKKTEATYDPNVVKNNFQITNSLGEDGDMIAIIKNNNNVDIYNFEIEALFYDKNNNLLGSSKRELDIFEKNQESATQFYDTPNNTLTAKFNIKVGTESSYESHLSEMKLTSSNTGEKIVIQIANSSNKKIEIMPVGVVFYRNNKIVGYNSYDNYDLAIGDTATINIDYPYDKSYDTVKFDNYKVFIKEAVCTK